jgi:hypothetical protein
MQKCTERIPGYVHARGVHTKIEFKKSIPHALTNYGKHASRMLMLSLMRRRVQNRIKKRVRTGRTRMWVIANTQAAYLMIFLKMYSSGAFRCPVKDLASDYLATIMTAQFATFRLAPPGFRAESYTRASYTCHYGVDKMKARRDKYLHNLWTLF